VQNGMKGGPGMGGMGAAPKIPAPSATPSA
jgi:hypothetical protein